MRGAEHRLGAGYHADVRVKRDSEPELSGLLTSVY